MSTKVILLNDGSSSIKIYRALRPKVIPDTAL